MTAPKTKHSAYPKTLPELVEAARTLGGDVSLRRLTRELHIGAPKAREVLAELARTGLRVVDSDAPASAPVSAPETHATDAPDTPTETHRDVAATAPEPPAADTTETRHTPVPDAPIDATTAGEAVTVPVAEPAADRVAGLVTEGPAGQEAARSDTPRRRVPVWPVLLLTLPALAAIWSGWVSLGGMAGFGVVHPLPGIADHVTLNTAITLPIGVEVYAAYALWVWLSGGVPPRAMRFARASAIASLVTGAAGQVTYHLLAAAHVAHAPWPITTLVACLPVAVLGMGAALAHLVRSH